MKKILLLFLIFTATFGLAVTSTNAFSKNWGIVVNKETNQCAGWQKEDGYGFPYKVPQGWSFYSADYFFESHYDFGDCFFNKQGYEVDIDDWRKCLASLGFRYVDYDEFDLPPETRCSGNFGTRGMNVFFMNHKTKIFTAAACDMDYFYSIFDTDSKKRFPISDDVVMYKKLISEVEKISLPAGVCYDNGRSPEKCCAQFGYNFVDNIWNENLSSRPLANVILGRIGALPEILGLNMLLVAIQFVFVLLLVLLFSAYREYAKKLIFAGLIWSYVILSTPMILDHMIFGSTILTSYPLIIISQSVLEILVFYFLIFKKQLSLAKIIILILTKNILGSVIFYILSWWAFSVGGFF